MYCGSVRFLWSNSFSTKTQGMWIGYHLELVSYRKLIFGCTWSIACTCRLTAFKQKTQFVCIHSRGVYMDIIFFVYFANVKQELCTGSQA